MPDTHKPVALIPAYQPAPALVPLVEGLLSSGAFAQVLVVDDGSAAACAAIFAALERLPGCTLLRHYVNLGKGAALKTGLNHCGLAFPAAPGVLTLDADGQHSLDDALKVACRLMELPERLVLGSRQFAGDVPLRSRFGNTLTRGVMRVVGGLKLQDTQTGLRGIPRALFPSLLRLRTNGYDFELDMLLLAKQHKVVIDEVPITTIYLDDNRSSHFNPLVDSLKIYLVFLRFNVSSLVAVLIDYSVFILALSLSVPLLGCIFLARLCSSLVNYFCNRHFVFKSNSSVPLSMLLYYSLVVALGLCSYGLILVFTSHLGMSVVAAKILAELLLYFASFSIQRELVFRHQVSA